LAAVARGAGSAGRRGGWAARRGAAERGAAGARAAGGARAGDGAVRRASMEVAIGVGGGE
jgi:hypothetical protein